MSHDIAGTLLCAASLLAAWFLARRYWRRQAIRCADQWATQRHLSVADWSKASFQMQRQSPTLAFIAASAGHASLDVKLRFRIPMFGAWRVDEVACCLPVGVCEDDAATV